MAYDYDLAVIGAGWAGFNAARQAQRSGLKACLLEKSRIGGTCLNLGCIPTKALIQSAKTYNLAKKASNFGVEISGLNFNFVKAQARKDNLIRELRQGMQAGLKGADYINSSAELKSNQEIKSAGKVISAKYIIIAAGSRPTELPGFEFDNKNILSSDQLLEIKALPQSLLIIGGGVIGCEFASLFAALGTKVAVAEKMPRLLPGEDQEVSKKIETVFKKRGIKVDTNTDARSLSLSDYSLTLVCVGRMPVTAGLGLEGIGVKVERSAILTNEYLQTSIPNIFAAGDCTAKIMLAHFAAYQGIVSAQNCAYPDALEKADNPAIPNCIFTDPEAASVGLSEAQANRIGIEVNLHRFDFLGSGMARILDETEGFIKIVSQRDSGEIIGAAIIGPRAAELIGILTLAISSRLKVSQVRDTIFAHPTVSESIKEAL
ncbi:MAG: dihydrolipoyl dehydrogenase [Omnitrophica WOR_2 bacterium RIFCSPLOWO2_12_FULL_51_8]|nr:MAG: dihydrolipoyl dehydrogenase [Omnitrophica WOR_2 bacterium RIFCSPLOWO2_12_FULL_51_8]